MFRIHCLNSGSLRDADVSNLEPISMGVIKCQRECLVTMADSTIGQCSPRAQRPLHALIAIFLIGISVKNRGEALRQGKEEEGVLRQL